MPQDCLGRRFPLENITPTENSNAETTLESSSPPGVGLAPATWAIAGAVGKWVGEKVAGGIVGAAAGKLFSEVMDAIGMGGPDLVVKLDQISNQITEVQRSLDRLTAMTAEILKQLAELRDFMEKALEIQTLTAAMLRIGTAYGRPGQPPVAENLEARAVSLRMLTEDMPHYAGITKEYLQAAAKDFANYVGDMPDCIATIQSVLVKAAFGQDSLLTHWARELARQVNANKITREDAYLVLEGYFLQAISIQLKGVSVHCVAQAVDPFGPQLIKDYLEKTYAPMMTSQTAAFVEAVELLIFTTLKPSMPTGLQDGKGEREFPSHVDELLLRADLISAALNLVAHKPDQSGKLSPTIQAAIQGIYGRALFRPSDLNNGTPPAFGIAGFSAVAGKAVRQLPFPCLDLSISNGQSVLRNVNDTFATIAHYSWPFPSPPPKADEPIDSNQRGKVTPKLYPAFGPGEDGVLAASVFDVSRLYRGLPSGTAYSYKYDKFPKASDDLGYYDEKCVGYHHPLTNDKGDAFETNFKEVHIWRLNIFEHSYVTHPLFIYTGPKIRVRITAFVSSIIHRDPRLDGQGGTAFEQTWDLFNRLRLAHPNGSKNEFYNSVDSYGSDHPVSVNGSGANWDRHKNYDCRRDGAFTIDFDLDAGKYDLVLDSEVAVWRAPQRHEGWQSSSLAFFLHGLSIERL